MQEIGGRIPRGRDCHVNPDGTLCLAVAEEMWIKCQCRFDLRSFLAGPLRTFLLSNSLVEQGAAWPHGERSHGAVGICEFYQEAVGFGDARQVLDLLRYLCKPRLKGHWPCPCGSEKNMRHCHHETIAQLHARVPTEVFERSLTFLRSRA